MSNIRSIVQVASWRRNVILMTRDGERCSAVPMSEPFRCATCSGFLMSPEVTMTARLGSHRTPRWRGMDSNFQYAEVVKMVVAPFSCADCFGRVGAPVDELRFSSFF